MQTKQSHILAQLRAAVALWQGITHRPTRVDLHPGSAANGISWTITTDPTSGFPRPTNGHLGKTKAEAYATAETIHLTLAALAEAIRPLRQDVCKILARSERNNGIDVGDAIAVLERMAGTRPTETL